MHQLSAYFRRKRQKFELKLAPEGTEFQLRIWAELMKIPFGRTITYLQLAERFGDPLAARAVAQAVAHNAIAIVVPCHRVIGSDGSLTGYGGGLPAKQYLLELEGALRQPTLYGALASAGPRRRSRQRG
jgi:methylated-DNA-[protein]-cysteine S-methyltransferase